MRNYTNFPSFIFVVNLVSTSKFNINYNITQKYTFKLWDKKI